MRSVIKELGTFIKSDFNFWFYLFFFIFLAIAIHFNYSYNLYWNYINIAVSGTERFIRFFLLFSLTWFIVALPKLIVSKKTKVFQKTKFLFVIILILLTISFDSAFSVFKPLLKYSNTFDEQLYLTRILTNFQGIVIFSFFALIFILNKFSVADLGLKLRGLTLKPYFLLIIGIVPMIVWASFNAEFIATYPQYKPWEFPLMFKMPKLVSALIYEFLYGIDFITIEFAFRGLLVILIARFIGNDAVLPMAAVYCFLHFGKPEAEAISSVFGGYFLGVVALSTRSIAPGIILHLSLAYMMDISAYIQHYFK